MAIRRIRDIPKFAAVPTHDRTIELTGVNRWIKEAEELGQKVDLDPDFQRGVVWKKPQQTAYIEYLLAGGISARDFYWNCTDYLTNGRNKIVLIDGKQRLTSIRLFLSNKIEAYGTFYKDFEDRRMAGRQLLRFHVSSLDNNIDIYRFFLSLNATGVAHDKAGLDKVRKLIKKDAERG